MFTQLLEEVEDIFKAASPEDQTARDAARRKEREARIAKMGGFKDPVWSHTRLEGQDEPLWWVPDQASIDYKGFTVWMDVRAYTALANYGGRGFDTRAEETMDRMLAGDTIAPVWFTADWHDDTKTWAITGFEGYERVEALRQLGYNKTIPVDIFPGGGMRSRSITPEMVEAFLTKPIGVRNQGSYAGSTWHAAPAEHLYPIEKLVLRGGEYKPEDYDV